MSWRHGVHSGHRLHQLNRRSWVRISSGCQVFRTLCIHCNAVLCNLIRVIVVVVVGGGGVYLSEINVKMKLKNLTY
jgi:hypothetical protein